MSLRRSLFAATSRSYNASARRLAAAESTTSGASLVLNFCTPHSPIMTKKTVDKIILPGEAGEFGLTAGHSPIISQLKAGVVTIIHLNVRIQI